jgi:mono/diheme cytochrome c family protein
VAPPTPSAPATAAAPSSANLGKQIFTTGIGSSGKHVPYTQGMDMGPSGIGGCADCHGADGKGMDSMKSPAIIYNALRKPLGKKPPMYASDDALKQPIEKGLDEDGKPVSSDMPRWQLSDQEFQAVVAYLKTLDTAPPASATGPAGGTMGGMKGMGSMNGMKGMGSMNAMSGGQSVPPPPP